MVFSELDKLTGGEIIQLHQDLTISHLVTDSRRLVNYQGALFFAIPGEQHDGHNFINSLYESGVKQFVVEKPVSGLPKDCNIIKVDNTLEALQNIASAHRSGFFYPIIGITGSNAKTIVKEWLATFLERRYHVIKSPKSYNSQLGVPLSVWQMNDNHNLGIFEAGISKPGEMKKLERIIKPDIGIFTNIGTAHDEGFESREQKIKEKVTLFKSSKAIVYCRDHSDIHDQLSILKGVQLISWSQKHEEATVRCDFNKNLIKVTYQHKEYFFSTRFEDAISIENLLHCITASLVLGFSQHDIQAGIDGIQDVNMRLEMKHGINGCYLIDDSYNNDFYGLEIALDFVNQQNQRPQKSIILSDILQSGKDAAALYYEVNELLKRKGISRLIGIGPTISKSKNLFELETEFFESTEEFLKSDISFSREMILIKGGRKFEFEQIVRQLEQKVHRTVLEVNLDALSHNLNFYRQKLDASTKIMIMVKAFAYGGSYEIANLMQYHNVDYLGVAYTDEGVLLRKNGINTPIMVMNPTEDSFQSLEQFDLHPEIYSQEMLDNYLTFFANKSRIPAIHIKLESGMNRLGFKEENIDKLIEFIWQNPALKIAGIFTHLAGSESSEHEEFTHGQVKKFQRMVDKILPHLQEKPIIHVVNSAGILKYPEYHFDMVRLGIGLYGFESTGKNQNDLRVVSQLKTTISQIKHVKKGQSVGYSRVGVADKSDMKIAVLAIGYADGFRRSLSNGVGQVNINGHLVPVVGNVCMDMTMVDITGVDAREGDEAIIFGANPTISQLGEWMNTIPYEILTNVSERVKRVFYSG